MEQLSEESVEQYADFFFRLSDAQLKERIAEFNRKQPIIFGAIDACAKHGKTPQSADLVWRLALLMVHCFEAVETKIPMVNVAALKQFEKDYTKRMNDFKPESPEDTFGYSEAVAMEQPCFINWMANKLDASQKTDKIVTFEQASHIHNTLILTGHLFKRAILLG